MNKHTETAAAERELLRLLCQCYSSGSASGQLWRTLEEYSWREPEHQVLFSALSGLRRFTVEAIRSQLPARLTRLGFPDLDWSYLFEPLGASREQVLARIGEVLGLELPGCR